MRNVNLCKMCRYAARCDDREERRCLNPEAADGIVRAEAPACPLFQVSAWSYLESVARAEKRIEDMTWRENRFREMAQRATGSTEAVRVSGTGSASKVSANMDKCMDIGIRIQDEAETLGKRYKLACEMIEGVSLPEGRQVLELRHLSRLPWEAIAEKMHYGPRQLARIHRWALEEVQGQMDELGIFE